MCTTTIPSCLDELLREAVSVREQHPDMDGAAALLHVLQHHHVWPALQIKRGRQPGLVLLNNTYDCRSVAHFQQLYDECRSVYLDMTDASAARVIVAAPAVPTRMVVGQYNTIVADTDSCIESFDGTAVTVFNHADTWLFGTSGCTDVNRSRFATRSKSHGAMLDEALAAMFADATEDQQPLRDRLTSHLDVTKAYVFVIVHHQNTRATDYSDRLGAGYARLAHVLTVDRATQVPENITNQPLLGIGVLYPRTYVSPMDALAALQSTTDPNTPYAVVVTRVTGDSIKVSRDSVVTREEVDYGSPNPWLNALWVYMRSRPDYGVAEYVAQRPDVAWSPIDLDGTPMFAVDLINDVMRAMCDVLYHFYVSSTRYNVQTGRFRMDREADAAHTPMIRFHLAQLRRMQVTEHTHGLLTKKAVMRYLCFNLSIKNMQALIHAFAQYSGFLFAAHMSHRFVTLSCLLRPLPPPRPPPPSAAISPSDETPPNDSGS